MNTPENSSCAGKRKISVPTYQEMIGHHKNDWGPEDRIFQDITGRSLADDTLGEPVLAENLQSEKWRISTTLTIIIPVGIGKDKPAERWLVRMWELKHTMLALARQKNWREMRSLIEIVVVVDGAGENPSIAKAIPYWMPTFELNPRIRVCQLNIPCGANVARNVGIYYARGDVVLFLDSDMLLHPNFIGEHLVRHEYLANIALASFRLDENPCTAQGRNWIVGFTAGKCDFPESLESDIKQTWPFKPAEGTGKVFYTDTGQCKRVNMDGLLTERIFSTACSSVSRHHALAVGGFQNEYTGWGMEDTDLGSRLLARGVRLIPSQFTIARHINNPEEEKTLDNEAKKALQLERNKGRHDLLMREIFRESPANVISTVERLLATRILQPLYEIDESGRYMSFFHSASAIASPQEINAEGGLSLGRVVEVLFERSNQRVVDIRQRLGALLEDAPYISQTDLRWTLMMESRPSSGLVTVAAHNNRDDPDRNWKLLPGKGIRGWLLRALNGAEDEGDNPTAEDEHPRCQIKQPDEAIVLRVNRHEICCIPYNELDADSKNKYFKLEEKQIADTRDIAFYACYPIRVRTGSGGYRSVGVFTVHSDRRDLLDYFLHPDHDVAALEGSAGNAAQISNKVYWVYDDYSHVHIDKVVDTLAPEASVPLLDGNKRLTAAEQAACLSIISSSFRSVRKAIEDLIA